MTEIRSCDRCGVKIVEDLNRRESFNVTRHTDDGYETKSVRFCSICKDELWRWVEGEDVDRSDVADPVPLARMEKQVRRHIDELESIVEEL